MKYGLFFLACSLATAAPAYAETHFVTLGPNGYSNTDLSVYVGDYVSIQASSAHPLKFEMNPDVRCTNAQCAFLFSINAGPFHFYCENHASEQGSISTMPNDDIIQTDGFDILLIPVDA